MKPPSCLRSLRFRLSLAGSLALLASRSSRAESDASYKYETYDEANGRIAVKTHNALLEQDLGTDMHVKVEGVIDSITGATPTGLPAPAGSTQVDLTQMHDRRKAWNAELLRQFPGFSLTLGVANSRESDYVSNGWSINTVTEFNQKNTLLLAGVAGTNDNVQEYFQPDHAYVKKRTNDLILGVNQLLDPHTSVTVNLSWGRAVGYLSDPHKVVPYLIVADPGPPPIVLLSSIAENRPDERNKWILYASLNRSFPEVRGALEASYRFYHDTFGTNAHTLQASWLQRLGDPFILQPELRLYQQTAASFYYYDLTRTSIVPTGAAPHPAGPFFSSDYRLAALRSYTYGLKLTWVATPWLQLDFAVREYEMRGRDGVTPDSAFPRARIVSSGVKFSW